MSRFLALYAFEAEEEGELSVAKGDMLSASAGDDGVFGTADDTRDGWLLVDNPRTQRSGYVPVDYLQQQPDAAPSAAAAEPPPPAIAAAPMGMAPAAAGASDMSSLRNEFAASVGGGGGGFGADGGAGAVARNHTYGDDTKISFKASTATPSTPSLATAVASENFDALMQQNEDHYAQLTKTRTTVFREIEEAAAALESRIAADNAKGAELVSKLEDIGTIIEQQRRQMKKTVEQDKMNLANGLAGLA